MDRHWSVTHRGTHKPYPTSTVVVHATDLVKREGRGCPVGGEAGPDRDLAVVPSCGCRETPDMAYISKTVVQSLIVPAERGAARELFAEHVVNL